MNVFKTKYKGCIVVLLIALLAGLFWASNLSIHSHEYPDYTVTHSHPYSSSQPHSHTGGEIATIYQLSLFVALSIVAIVAIKLHVTLLNNNILCRDSVTILLIIGSHQLRGPPVL